MNFFFDTNVLIDLQEKIYKNNNHFFISSVTVKELEAIKNNDKKSPEIKYKARKAVKYLVKYEQQVTIIPFNNKWKRKMNRFSVLDSDSPDSQIIYTALQVNKKEKDLHFVTNDWSCRNVANSVGLKTFYRQIDNEEDLDSEYKGFLEVILTDNEMGTFYSSLNENKNYFNLLTNEYLILRNSIGEVIDQYKWTEGGYKQIKYISFDSKIFGKIKPKDVYQNCIMDSLSSNQLSIIRGNAGTGKSLIGLAYLFQELEKGKIDKIIMFVNPVATKDSCKFGFLPGTATEKILGSQIGYFLATKLGDISIVEKMINDGTLMLIPVADCRGIDMSGLHAGIYFTEAQNATIDMIKLMLQRIDDKSICIFEGDDKTQVDMGVYSGVNNGLRRLSEVFRGENYYGEVTLQNCYRSQIAAKAEEM